MTINEHWSLYRISKLYMKLTIYVEISRVLIVVASGNKGEKQLVWRDLRKEVKMCVL